MKIKYKYIMMNNKKEKKVFILFIRACTEGTKHSDDDAIRKKLWRNKLYMENIYYCRRVKNNYNIVYYIIYKYTNASMYCSM